MSGPESSRAPIGIRGAVVSHWNPRLIGIPDAAVKERKCEMFEKERADKAWDATGHATGCDMFCSASSGCGGDRGMIVLTAAAAAGTI